MENRPIRKALKEGLCFVTLLFHLLLVKSVLCYNMSELDLISPLCAVVAPIAWNTRKISAIDLRCSFSLGASDKLTSQRGSRDLVNGICFTSLFFLNIKPIVHVPFTHAMQLLLLSVGISWIAFTSKAQMSLFVIASSEAHEISRKD